MFVPFADPLLRIELPDTALPCIGRETELQLARSLLEGVVTDRPVGARALTIVGEVGVGKSRFLAEIYNEARAQGFQVLEESIFEAGGGAPYQAFAKLLRALLQRLTVARLRAHLGLTINGSAKREAQPFSLAGPELVAALAGLLPELPELLALELEPETLSPEQRKFRLLDGVAILLEQLAQERPLLLGIDNLQWADSASLELMMYLMVRLHRAPVILLGATRPTPRLFADAGGGGDLIEMEMAIKSAQLLQELMRHGLLMYLPLAPLSEEALSHYLHTLLPGKIAPALEQALIARVEGNPFFLEELVRMLMMRHDVQLQYGLWQASGTQETLLPYNVRLAIEERLQGVSSGCRSLLRSAALIGRSFSRQVLASLKLVDEVQLEGLLREAIEVGLLRLRGRGAEGDAAMARLFGDDLQPGLLFCQGIVWEVLSAEVPTDEGRELHGRIGKVLEVVYAGHYTSERVAEIAHHYLASGVRLEAVRWCQIAGEEAARKQAHREAIRYFGLILSLTGGEDAAQNGRADQPSAARLQLAIGDSWFKLGELEHAQEALMRALELARSERAWKSDRASLLLVARVNRLLADAYRMQGKFEQAQAHLQAATGLLDAVRGDNAAEPSSLVEEEAQAPWFSGPGMREALNASGVERVYAQERMLLLQAQATLDLLHFRVVEAEQALRASLQLAVELGDLEGQAFALFLTSWVLGWGEQIHGALRLQKQAQELYLALGDPFRTALVDQSLGIIYHALGEMKQAHLYTLRGLECAQRYGVRNALGWLYWNQGVLALAQGNWTSCEAHLKEAEAEAEGQSTVRLLPVVFQAQAQLQFRKGAWREAERLFLASIQEGASSEWYPSCVALYGHFLAVTGRREEARTQLERAAALPEPPGYAGHFYIPFLAEGYIHLGASEQASAYVERLRRLRGFMYYGLSVDRILGVVATQAGDWQAADQAFEDGLRLCEKAGNQPEQAQILYEQARMLVVQSGAQAEPSAQLAERIRGLCTRASEIFAQYEMERAQGLVETLQAGLQQLERPRQAPERAEPRADERFLEIKLTKRELEVLRLVAEGYTDREVAELLVISPRTANRHLSNIFVKLDVSGRAPAVAYAIRQGLV